MRRAAAAGATLNEHLVVGFTTGVRRRVRKIIIVYVVKV